MPDVLAAYSMLLRHAAMTASPASIVPMAEAIVREWRQIAQGAGGEAAFRHALGDLRHLLVRAAQQARADGRVFEARTLEEAIRALDAAGTWPGAAP